MDYEVAVIGAGPGGLVTALYLRRFMRKTLLASAGPPRASWIPRSHNILGFREGISGAKMLEALNAQIDDCKIDRSQGECRVDPRPRGGFTITCGTRRFTAEKVVLATGMCDVQPALKNLVSLRKSGLLRYCPVCDAYEFKDKKLLVLAQDSHGLKTTSFLSGFSDDVHMLWPAHQKLPARLARTRTWRGGPIIVGELVSIARTKTNTLDVMIKNEQGKIGRMKFDACYVALGSTINDSAFRHIKKVKRDEDGCILVRDHQETDQPGLYAVGDCVRGLAQVSVAAGQAAIAATHIHNSLRHGRGR